MPQNPFVYNHPVLNSDFFDRELILENMLRETIMGKTQGDVWLTGERKTGKTSFLKYLFSYNKQIPKEIVVYGTNNEFRPQFCFANVQYCRNEDEFYNELWQSLNNEFDFKLKRLKNAESNFLNALRFALENKIFPILLVDEFDAFLEVLAIESAKSLRLFINRLNSYLNNAFDAGHKVFSAIFSSNNDFIDLNTKYDLKITGSGIIAELYSLDWFTEKQLFELAQTYLHGKVIRFTEREIKFLYKYTNGYPYFSQKLLSLMYDYKKKNILINEIDELIIREFAQYEYDQTIRFWLGQNMPRRTNQKLISLLEGIGEKVFDTALKVLIEYSKSKF